MDYPALEHGTTRTGRWLRERRLWLALWVAVAEGVLVVAGVVPAWAAILAAAVATSFYLFVGRSFPWQGARQGSWILATSQVLVALVPVLAFVVTALAIVALVVLAVVALVALLLDRS